MAACAITELTLSHFRSHRLTRLRPDARPMAIHGPNGAGKTNILEAVSLLSPGRGLRRAKSEDFVRRPEAIGWKVSGVVETGGRQYEVETGAEPGEPRVVRIDGKTSPQVGLGRVARVVWLVPSMDRLWIEGAEGRRRFLDRMTMSFTPEHGDVVLAYEKAMRERNRLLKDMVRDDQWYRALEQQMGEAGAGIMRHRHAALARLAEAQLDAETAFPAADLALTHPDAELPEDADALNAALAGSRSADLRAGRTLIGPHRVDMTAVYAAKGVPADQCSTGEQKALLVSLILTNARALAEDTGAPPLILLDEVAAHLDASRRAALFDEICALGAQAWMTGTGPELFTDLGDRAQFFEIMEADGVSEVAL
ncbi:MAG: DNA replication/repair protein RecF [Paracoccaceae bacterium]|nr:DNA replication/repair protein RecF [Paracoccaceae bacterium]